MWFQSILYPDVSYRKGGGQQRQGGRPQTLLSLNIYDPRTPRACCGVGLEIPNAALGALYVKGILKVVEDHRVQTG